MLLSPAWGRGWVRGLQTNRSTRFQSLTKCPLDSERLRLPRSAEHASLPVPLQRCDARQPRLGRRDGRRRSQRRAFLRYRRSPSRRNSRAFVTRPSSPPHPTSPPSGGEELDEEREGNKGMLVILPAPAATRSG